MPVLREGGMVGNLLIQLVPYEFPESQVDLDLLHELAFRSNAVKITYKQYPDKHFRVNGRPPSMRV